MHFPGLSLHRELLSRSCCTGRSAKQRYQLLWREAPPTATDEEVAEAVGPVHDVSNRNYCPPCFDAGCARTTLTLSPVFANVHRAGDERKVNSFACYLSSQHCTCTQHCAAAPTPLASLRHECINLLLPREPDDPPMLMAKASVRSEWWECETCRVYFGQPYSTYTGVCEMCKVRQPAQPVCTSKVGPERVP